MRKLDKGAPIQHFVDFIRHNHHDRWEDAKEASPIWREHILNQEQHGLSGYTEAPIRYENSHIDRILYSSGTIMLLTVKTILTEQDTKTMLFAIKRTMKDSSTRLLKMRNSFSNMSFRGKWCLWMDWEMLKKNGLIIQ